MTARVHGNPSNAPRTGEWVNSLPHVAGQLWERVAESGSSLPDWLWNGGKPVEDDDLFRKQRIEEHIAWGEGE